MYDASSYQIFAAESRQWQPDPAVEEDERAYIRAVVALLRAERLTEECSEAALPRALGAYMVAEELVEDTAQALREYGATDADILALADQARDEWLAQRAAARARGEA